MLLCISTEMVSAIVGDTIPVMVLLPAYNPSIIAVIFRVTELLMTVKFGELKPVPLLFCTEIDPVVAPTGTIAVICPALLIVKGALVPLKATVVVP